MIKIYSKKKLSPQEFKNITMKLNLKSFIENPTEENFLKLQLEVTSSEEYNPYSFEIYELESLLDDEKFEEVVQYENINTILSPSFHFLKNYALEQLNRFEEAEIEYEIATSLLLGIESTGNGTKEAPFIITRISDENDILMSLAENKSSQNLIEIDNTYFDVIKCESGKEIYFDITKPYLRNEILIEKRISKNIDDINFEF